eukprot:TRINITY_DN27178_c0_g1_i1.p1 TRINITY_DN27178_c0_g1~~TRINITY_DN27178_c0_g1_i1.p1  ORF type:complete len:1835 (-),score=290.54 TRINITY_DN27178_c0_g1_i1:77-5581(-)
MAPADGSDRGNPLANWNISAVFQKPSSTSQPPASARPELSSVQRKAKDAVRQIFEECLGEDGLIKSDHLVDILRSLDANFPSEHIAALVSCANEDEHGSVAFKAFLDELWPEPAVSVRREEDATLLQKISDGKVSLEDAFVQTSFAVQLTELVREHPYLEPGSTFEPHHLHYWVKSCRETLKQKKFAQAQFALRRLIAGLNLDKQQIAEAFRRFDANDSGHLDEVECRHMCAYLGWGSDEADLLDVDRDGRITLQDFQLFVGRLGGVQQLFEHRRLRISASRKDVDDYAGLAVGSRVRAHFYCHRQKSRSWREATVLGVGVEKKPADGIGPVTYGVLLEFRFGNTDKQTKWKARQVVPPTWVLSSVEDASVASALREIGLLDEAQSFWSLLLPDTEMRAIEQLVDCQRKALAGVRAHSTESHNQKLPALRERFKHLGFSGRELQSTLGWIQDFAPVCVHVHLDKMGRFMESDEFYRNQFETKTSCGSFDPQNLTRTGWETELFGGAYDNAKGFDRVKYGALNVMNDYRGVVKANQYGDSYLVLKDVRLRCTFASTDSGGMAGSRLAVLDKYAHVLAEYNDTELKGLVEVAMAATTPGDSTIIMPQLLRGSTHDTTRDWVTMGYPDFSQQSGQFYFEVYLQKGCGAPQVGLLSTKFECQRQVPSSQGVGDDENGWAADGLNVALWHGGMPRPCAKAWPGQSKEQGVRILSEDVVVGVAVDLDARSLRFSTNGDWDHEVAFCADDIPEDTALYPALSLRGKASFIFGPDFRYSPPKSCSAFVQWPGGLRGEVRVDTPRIGNEEILVLYKEVQIHGEVSLKRHVQRLVATPKYRNLAKTQRSYSLRVTGCRQFAGTYDRAPAHNSMTMYRSLSGAVIFCDLNAGFWRMSENGDVDKYYFWAPFVAGTNTVPRTGWTTHDEARGFVDSEAFKLALKTHKAAPTCSSGHHMGPAPRPFNVCDVCRNHGTSYRCTVSCDYDMCDTCFEAAVASCKTTEGVSDEVVKHLCDSLCSSTPDGRVLAYWAHNETTFEAEWAKLDGVSGNPDGVWEEAIKNAQRKLKKEAGFGEGVIIETEHPYSATRFSLNKEVHVDGVAGLTVHFCTKSCTLDARARFRVFSGGIRRDSAGIGARVEVTAPGSGGNVASVSGGKVWGTVAQRSEGLWKIRLDVAEERIEKIESSCLAIGEAVEGKYKNGKWYPATIAKIQPDGTYLLNWNDGDSADRIKRSDELRRRAAPDLVANRNLVDLARYAKVPEVGQECFAVCLEEPARITIQYVTQTDAQGYYAKVGDEIRSFSLDRSSPLMPIHVEGFVGPGPAQKGGVLAGWYLDLPATLGGPSQSLMRDMLKGLGDVEDMSALPDDEFVDVAFRNLAELHKRLNEGLLAMKNVTLIFTNSCSTGPVQVLPEAYAAYAREQLPSEEIKDFFMTSQGAIKVSGFAGKGPAQSAGIRMDWTLDVAETLRQNFDSLAELQGLSDSIAASCVAVPPPATYEFKLHEITMEYIEDKMAMGMMLQQKMEALMASLGWDGPEDFKKAYPDFEPDFKVYDVSGKEFAGPHELEACGSERWPIVLKMKLPAGKIKEDVDQKSSLPELPDEVCVRCHEHPLQKFDNGSTTWYCDSKSPKCTRRSEGPTVRWSCRQCGFDQCRGCVNHWKVQSEEDAIELTPEQKNVLQHARSLLAKAGITLVFKQPNPQPTLRYQFSGAAGLPAWKTCHIQGDFAGIEFSTDGDGIDQADKRWGVLALVMPRTDDAEPSGDLEQFFTDWVETSAKGLGYRETPVVERDGWDEGRLRSLCALHGWDFEWMTEDGERRRRANERWDMLEFPKPPAHDPAMPDVQLSS